MRKIKAVVESIESGFGILSIDSKTKIKIPEKLLPDKTKGAALSIDIKTEDEARLSDEVLAKKILNEILDTGD